MKIDNPKNVFWEAIVVAGAVFILGLLLGIVFESGRVKDINSYYAESEISLMDSIALNNLIKSGDYSCDKAISSNIDFADEIYGEAVLLEKYEEAGKIDDELKLIHKKYDLLRTILWTNVIEIKKKCPEEINSVVYLYEYDTEELVRKATQNVWENILFDLKQKKGNEIILIPIATNSNLTSLNLMMEEFNVTKIPAVIINEKDTLYELSSSEDLEKYLN